MSGGPEGLDSSSPSAMPLPLSSFSSNIIPLCFLIHDQPVALHRPVILLHLLLLHLLLRIRGRGDGGEQVLPTGHSQHKPLLVGQQAQVLISDLGWWPHDPPGCRLIPLWTRRRSQLLLVSKPQVLLLVITVVVVIVIIVRQVMMVEGQSLLPGPPNRYLDPCSLSCFVHSPLSAGTAEGEDL